MNRKIILCTAFSLMLLSSSSAFASLLSFATSDYSCKDMVGVWTGNGTVRNKLIKCEYAGESKVQSAGNDRYKASMYLKRAGGGVVCPAKLTLMMEGICVNNYIEVNTEVEGVGVHLSGPLEEKYAHLEGKITNPQGTLEIEMYQQ